MKKIKQLNLTITLRGRVLLSEQECSKNSKTSYDHFNLRVFDGKKSETLYISTRKSHTAFRVMHFSPDQINYMLDTPVSGFPPKHWKHLPLNQRIDLHCKNIAHDLQGINYKFTLDYEDQN